MQRRSRVAQEACEQSRVVWLDAGAECSVFLTRKLGPAGRSEGNGGPG